MTQTHPRPSEQSDDLTGSLGVPQIVFMVVAMAAPLTVVAGLVPLMFAFGNGVGVPLDFVLMGLVLMLFTVGFSAMTPEVADAGAFYSYVQKGLGKVAGFGAAALAITTYVVLLVAVSAYLGEATRNVLITLVGVSLPWWGLSAACLLAIGFLGYRNIEMSARVLGVFLIAELLIVAIVDLAILARGGERGLSADSFTWDGFSQGAVGIGFMFAIFGFIGFEATAVFRSEAKRPEVTIPRATYAAVLSIAGVYAFSSWALIMGAGSDKVAALAASDPGGFTPNLATAYVSSVAHDAMQVLLATSFFACVLTAHNVVSRYLFTLARQEALPAMLGRAHPVHRSPHRASLIASGIVAVILATMALFRLDPVVEIYGWLGGAGTLGLIMLLTLTSFAIVAHFWRSPRRVSFWRGTLAPGLAFLGLVLVLVLVIRNFELLIGTAWISYLLISLMVLALVGGLVWGVSARSRRPAAN